MWKFSFFFSQICSPLIEFILMRSLWLYSAAEFSFNQIFVGATFYLPLFSFQINSIPSFIICVHFRSLLPQDKTPPNYFWIICVFGLKTACFFCIFGSSWENLVVEIFDIDERVIQIGLMLIWIEWIKYGNGGKWHLCKLKMEWN